MSDISSIKIRHNGGETSYDIADVSARAGISELDSRLASLNSAVSSAQNAVDGMEIPLVRAQNTADSAYTKATAAMTRADRVPDKVYPDGIIIIADEMPLDFGTWEEVDIGLTGTKAWKRYVI